MIPARPRGGLELALAGSSWAVATGRRRSPGPGAVHPDPSPPNSAAAPAQPSGATPGQLQPAWSAGAGPNPAAQSSVNGPERWEG